MGRFFLGRTPRRTSVWCSQKLILLAKKRRNRTHISGARSVSHWSRGKVENQCHSIYRSRSDNCFVGFEKKRRTVFRGSSFLWRVSLLIFSFRKKKTNLLQKGRLIKSRMPLYYSFPSSHAFYGSRTNGYATTLLTFTKKETRCPSGHPVLVHQGTNTTYSWALLPVRVSQGVVALMTAAS